MSDASTVQFTPIYRELPIKSACPACRKVLAEGRWMISVETKDAAGARKFLAGHNPPIACCGKQQAVPLLFSSKNDTQERIQQLEALFRETQSLASMKLLAPLKLHR